MLGEAGVKVRLRLLAQRHDASYKRAGGGGAAKHAGIVRVWKVVSSQNGAVAVDVHHVGGGDAELPLQIAGGPVGTGRSRHEDVRAKAAVGGKEAAAAHSRHNDGVRAVLGLHLVRVRIGPLSAVAGRETV